MSSYHTTEAQADTLEGARNKLQRELLPGHLVLKSIVLEDGLPKTVEAEAESLKAALQKAKAELPSDSKIIKENVIRDSAQETLEVVAFDEDEARKKADVRPPRRIQSVSIKEPGRKGLLGMGKRPSTFTVVVFQPAKVAI